MFRRIGYFITVLAVLLVGAAPARAAENVSHYTISFSEGSTMPVDDFDGCLPYANGSIYEHRSYDIKVTEFVDGPRQGQVQFTGVAIGDFVISPAAGESGLVYTGVYREKFAGMGTSLDSPRVISFTLPITATGSDGSTIKMMMHGHVTLTPSGELKVEKFDARCIRPAQ